MSMKFKLGQIVATPGAIRILKESGQTPEFFLEKHACGSYGHISKGDAELNEEAIMDGSRIMSAYRTLKGKELWVITEACGESGEREVTTLLLPEDY